VVATSRDSGSSKAGRAASAARPLVTVVVPVFNGGDEIVGNVSVIRRSIEDGLPGEAIELVVVSDGSIDGTAERLLESASGERLRVIHYDRNLGKGYAVKLGALAARGEWVALVDADLDLDPAAIPGYVETARRERLDFAIGSKRHPDSVVHYPRSRRVASWCYQQLNRMLFRLDVRDTQVGLKVFRREVAERVVPLLLVKQFAFDLELLAVARALGYSRMRELPVRLDYRFTGSGVGSSAVARALWDTAAVFYRLRILGTYRRKRLLVEGATQRQPPPLVSLVGAAERATESDYAHIEVVGHDPVSAARGELIAVIAEGARPARNWLSAVTPYFAGSKVACVLVPELTPLTASLRERVAGAVRESRLGSGSRRSRYFPGNIREVDDQPLSTFVVRRSDYVTALEHSVGHERLVAWLAGRCARTIYTPDSMIAAAPPPLVGPHVRATVRHAEHRGAAARASRGTSLSAVTALSLAPAASAFIGVGLLRSDEPAARRIGMATVACYALAVGASSAVAARRFRSPLVGVLAAPALVLTHAAYATGFVRGLLRSP
jgi:glycosyltransferase involved in cell wall biosynthesis